MGGPIRGILTNGDTAAGIMCLGFQRAFPMGKPCTIFQAEIYSPHLGTERLHKDLSKARKEFKNENMIQITQKRETKPKIQRPNPIRPELYFDLLLGKQA